MNAMLRMDGGPYDGLFFLSLLQFMPKENVS
jgi:hypothetical protein